jgi:uncharacterized protein (TIGR02757 family)
LREFLESNFDKFHKKDFLESDPILFVYRYTDPIDREIVAFISSALAYGKVTLINKSLETVFELMGESPKEYLEDFTPEYGMEELRDFKHRFNVGEDVLLLFHYLSQMIKKDGSIEGFVASGLKNREIKNPSAKGVLQVLVEDALALDCSWLYTDGKLPEKAGVKWFFSDPSLGSACKRLNLFLRWMVRSDEIDPGGWELLKAKDLIMPVDVHIGRLAILTGLTTRKTISWRMSEEITSNLRKVNPDDPLKYDFSLCRLGILGHCNGTYQTDKCPECSLYPICSVPKS